MTTAIAFIFGALTALGVGRALINQDADAAFITICMWALFILYMLTT